MPPCHFFGKEPNLLTSDLPQTHSSFPLWETTSSLWTYDLSSAYQQALYSFALFFFFLIEVQLIYNITLVSDVQHSQYLCRLYSIMDYCKIIMSLFLCTVNISLYLTCVIHSSPCRPISCPPPSLPLSLSPGVATGLFKDPSRCFCLAYTSMGIIFRFHMQ